MKFKGKINLALNIGIGLGISIFLFVVPLLAICGIISGHHFTLDFTLFELLSILVGILITDYMSRDGTINRLEGVT